MLASTCESLSTSCSFRAGFIAVAGGGNHGGQKLAPQGGGVSSGEFTENND